MKFFLTTVFCLLAKLSIACSCLTPPSLCEYSKYVEKEENGIMFIGELMQVDSLDHWSKAYKFKIAKLIRGTVVTDSILYDNPNYFNTDSTIWIKGGSSASCLYWSLSSKSFFATTFLDGGYGYVPDICTPSYFPVDDNNKIRGMIWDQEKEVELNLDEIEEVIGGSCVSSTENIRNYLRTNISMYPNPTVDVLVLDYYKGYNNSELSYTLFDLRGNKLQAGIMEEHRKELTLVEYPDGIYLLSVELGGVVYTRKVLKRSGL